MEYQSTQYRAGHMTQDMETITIQKGEKEQTIVPTINHNDWLSSTYGCESCKLNMAAAMKILWIAGELAIESNEPEIG